VARLVLLKGVDVGFPYKEDVVLLGAVERGVCGCLGAANVDVADP